MKTILLFGAKGQVGWELQRSLSVLGHVQGVSSAQVNLTQMDAVRRIIQETKPNIIVNAAAYTAVDKAEEETHIAMAINGHAPEVMAVEAKKQGALLVHYSTDYVYRGDASSAYHEDAELAPLNVYGRSKLAGDQAIEAVGGDYLIFRTSWVYGARGQNFLLTMQRLMAARDALTIVGDQWGSPTWCRTIADATSQAIARRDGQSGVYHVSNEGETNWYEFAKSIRDLSGLRCELTPITTEQYPTPAKRPAYSVLSGDKIEETFQIRCPDWLQALALCLDAAEYK